MMSDIITITHGLNLFAKAEITICVKKVQLGRLQRSSPKA